VRVQLVVTYNDHTIMYYPILQGEGWKISNPHRCIVIGRMPRTYIPLDQVRSFAIEYIQPDGPGDAS
jgi:hypothetical protein